MTLAVSTLQRRLDASQVADKITLYLLLPLHDKYTLEAIIYSVLVANKITTAHMCCVRWHYTNKWGLGEAYFHRRWLDIQGEWCRLNTTEFKKITEIVKKSYLTWCDGYATWHAWYEANCIQICSRQIWRKQTAWMILKIIVKEII